MDKIVMRENPEFTAAYPDGWPCRIEIATRSGERAAADVKYFKGHAMTPLTDAEVELKFQRLSEPFLGPAEREALLRELWELETVDDTRTMLALLAAKPLRPEASIDA